MTNLHLIRHGEAEVNVRRVVGGMRGDTGLTPRGVLQAERLRDRLAGTGEIHADVLVASRLPRARQTAEILAPALGLPLTFEDDLRELDPGEADGMHLDEAVGRFGVPDFEREPTRPVSPGGESWSEFMARVAGLLSRLSRTHEGSTVVAVTHGGVIDGAFVHFLRMGNTTFPGVQFATRHASLTHWQRRPRLNLADGWRLCAYNDVLHLGDLDRPERIPWSTLAVRRASTG